MDKVEIPWAAGYFVYRDGRVQSPSGKFLKPQRIDHRGYMCVWPNGKKVRLHRLVATLFVENSAERTEVNHKDGDKSNNSADNLEWVSRTENMRHAMTTGLKRVFQGEKTPNAKLSDAEVAAIKSEYRKGVVGYSCAALAKKYGCDASNIWLIVSGKSRKVA